jgi:glutamine phosphoribosylpyrophosphate amidotransferase
MCGIFGVLSEKPLSLGLVWNLFEEASIRGIQSIGWTVLRDEQLHTHSEPIVTDSHWDRKRRLHDVLSKLDLTDAKAMIGHCRYATNYGSLGQPICLGDQTISITHNGVLSQNHRDQWAKEFPLLSNVQFESDNDSEMIWHVDSHQLDPFEVFKGNDTSFAVGTLSKDGRMACYRNGRRPLHIWKHRATQTVGFVSTTSILRRAVGDPHIDRILVRHTEPGMIYDLSTMNMDCMVNLHDYQR